MADGSCDECRIEYLTKIVELNQYKEENLRNQIAKAEKQTADLQVRFDDILRENKELFAGNKLKYEIWKAYMAADANGELEKVASGDLLDAIKDAIKCEM